MTNNHSRLYPDDQKRVDQVTQQGNNAVERKPFRPIRLMGWLVIVIASLGLLSRWLGSIILS